MRVDVSKKVIVGPSENHADSIRRQDGGAAFIAGDGT
jgi:hypothetical protein